MDYNAEANIAKSQSNSPAMKYTHSPIFQKILTLFLIFPTEVRIKVPQA